MEELWTKTWSLWNYSLFLQRINQSTPTHETTSFHPNPAAARLQSIGREPYCSTS
jgi:hypothetical protein